jgi:hypothetical protein
MPAFGAMSAPATPAPAPCIREVDLLFQIDTSNSMVEEQARLLSELPRLVEVLTTGDRDGDGAMDFQPITSLHLGVATPDLGGGTEPMVPTCPMGFGEDGVLRSRSGTIPPGCPAVFPSGIFQFRAGDDPAALADDFLCAAAVGTGGCGFEQQLEAVLVGLSPTVPTSWVSSSYGTPSFVGGRSPHGDRENDGFLREGSLLAITLVTDEDDCSTTDYGLFDPSNPRYAGTALNLRCNTFSDDLFPVGRYAEGYVQLREDPRLVVFSAITGIPLGSPEQRRRFLRCAPREPRHAGATERRQHAPAAGVHRDRDRRDARAAHRGRGARARAPRGAHQRGQHLRVLVRGEHRRDPRGHHRGRALVRSLTRLAP